MLIIWICDPLVYWQLLTVQGIVNIGPGGQDYKKRRRKIETSAEED